MTGWITESLAASTLLMLAVLALRRPLAARLGAGAAYLLWLLPALRLILPRLPGQAHPALPIAPVRIDVAALIRAAEARATTAPAATTLPPPAAAFPWTTLLLAAWISGALLFLGLHVLRHRRFLRAALALADAGHRHRGIVIQHSPAVQTPLATGLLRRQVLLPAGFGRIYTGPEQRLALAHELAHHRRGDLIANAAALIVLALHWFNPIAHWAYRAFRADQELACDATVIGRATAHQRRTYAGALLKAVRGPAAATACALGPATEIKRRMTMIARPSSGHTRPALPQIATTALVVAGLALTASRGNAAGQSAGDATLKPIAITTHASRHPDLRHPQADAGATDPIPPAPPASPAAPVPPVPPIAPVPPAPPAPPPADEALRDADAAQQDAAAARMNAATAAREAQASAADARAAAERAVASIDIDAIVQQAMAQAHAAIAACGKAGADKSTDGGAVIRTAVVRCVDTRHINREVAQGLMEGRREIAAERDMPADIRAKLLASFDRAIERLERADRP